MSDRRQDVVRVDPAHPDEINFGWLIRLRWSMVAGQLVTILGVRLLLGLALPLEAAAGHHRDGGGVQLWPLRCWGGDGRRGRGGWPPSWGSTS